MVFGPLTYRKTRLRAFKSLWFIFYDNAWPPLLVTTALWGGNGVAARAAAGEVTPMTLVFVRWVLVCIVLIALFHEQILRERDSLWRARRQILLMAGFGFTGFTVLFYIAGYYTTAVNMTLLQTAIPVLVLAGAAIFRGVPITWMQVIGMLVALSGILLIATHGAYAHPRARIQPRRSDDFGRRRALCRIYARTVRPAADFRACVLRRPRHERAGQLVSVFPD